PTRAKTCPGATVRCTSVSASTFPNMRLTPRTRSAGSGRTGDVTRSTGWVPIFKVHAVRPAPVAAPGESPALEDLHDPAVHLWLGAQLVGLDVEVHRKSPRVHRQRAGRVPVDVSGHPAAAVVVGVD